MPGYASDAPLAIEWATMVEILVNSHRLSYREAWGCTLRDFLIISGIQRQASREQHFDVDRIKEFEKHLKEKGVL